MAIRFFLSMGSRFFTSEDSALPLEKPIISLSFTTRFKQCQNQGPYANTFLYGQSVDNLVPTLLHPNELLDGCAVSGNYVWPAINRDTAGFLLKHTDKKQGRLFLLQWINIKCKLIYKSTSFSTRVKCFYNMFPIDSCMWIKLFFMP